MTAETVDTKVKELIGKPENRIKLHDFVHEETEKLFSAITSLQIPTGSGDDVALAARQWITQAEEAASALVKIFAYGCYFGTEDHAYLWKRTLERLSAPRDTTDLQRKLGLYPVMLIMYAGGVSAVAAQNGPALRSLLVSQITSQYSQERDLLISEVNGWLIEPRTANSILELNSRAPISEQVFRIISKLHPASLVGESNLTQAFNEWDIILSMTIAHHTSRDEARHQWVPVGRFAWDRDSLDNTRRDLDAQGEEWLPLVIGLFDRNLDDAKKALEATRAVARGAY
ncbi:hypothetical protein D3C73_17980 [compost metagenome]